MQHSFISPLESHLLSNLQAKDQRGWDQKAHVDFAADLLGIQLFQESQMALALDLWDLQKDWQRLDQPFAQLDRCLPSRDLSPALEFEPILHCSRIAEKKLALLEQVQRYL